MKGDRTPDRLVPTWSSRRLLDAGAIAALGIQFLRFTHQEVYAYLDAVIERIAETVRELQREAPHHLRHLSLAQRSGTECHRG